MKFEWDKKKAKANQSKHGVAFEEAQTVFLIRFMLTFMILIIVIMSIGILSSGDLSKTVY
jgi:uncharacterized DUF497 family protein